MRLATFARVLPFVTLLGASHGAARVPRYTHLYVLNPKEGVFAYARIAPDGRTLVYASEMTDLRTGRIMETETIVDLTTRKILFSDPGIDAYWSIDGKRMIWSGPGGVAIRHSETGAITPQIAPGGLGDYYSWAVRDGRDLILTIESNYYYLDGDKAVLPYAKVTPCGKMGTGERPLISKDGKRISTFFAGNVVVRGLDNCDDIIDTGIKGAKADFSWDGRYIAFHTLKSEGVGYDIKIVDLEKRTVRTLPGLKGSALFPSWTRDGRLCFRYDGPDYRGFMMASDVLDVPADPLPNVAEPLPSRPEWNDIFPGAARSPHRVQMVMIWAPWSAHTRDAFGNLEQARDYFKGQGADLDVAAAADPGSREGDIAHELEAYRVTIPRLPLTAQGLALTAARNQMPTTLLFRDGILVDRRLGALQFEDLKAWVGGALNAK
jgi:hypothetical protein